MARGFQNKEIASIAGKKSKRGPARPDILKQTYEDLVGTFKAGKYYVYKHIYLGEVVYIGKGKNQRAWDMNKARNDKYNEFCRHYSEDIDIRIVAAYLSEEEAFAIEQALIKTLNPKFNIQGLFYNLEMS